MTENTIKESKLIFNCGVARKLLKFGATIVDIKPDHNNSDKTIFVFKNNETFQKAFSELNEQIKKDKEML